MTPFQKRVFVALASIIAITRLLAISRSLFDWDEALFALGVREYDVVNHHPHPPGYPLFVAAAKLVNAMGVEEFRSLQTIVVLGSMLLFPALFLFAREAGFGFATAVSGAALFCFLPNVWLHGGTAFSDIPSMTLVLFACWLLLRGRREPRAYLLGAILLGIAAGFRPTSLVVGAIPAILATYARLRARDYRVVIGGAIVGAAIVAASYLGAAYATGSLSGYRKAVRAQSDYVRDTDSWRNPDREPLHEVAEDFFLRPMRQQVHMYSFIALGLISFITSVMKRRGPPLFMAAIFLPFACLVLLTLDVQAGGRYSIPYLSVYALLAADGLGILARHRVRVQAILVAVVIIVFAAWTWPALQLQRGSDSPPVAALRWAKEHVSSEQLFVHFGIAPQADYVFRGGNLSIWERPEEISPLGGHAWVIDLKPVKGGRNFIWPRTNPLWKIIRRRNFEASLARVPSAITLGPEWYGEERSGSSATRWMPRSATATLPPLEGKGRLYVRAYVPIDTLPAPPLIAVMLNGTVIELFTAADTAFEKSWIVASRSGMPNDLRITTSAVVNPSKMGLSADTRDLGLRVEALSWTTAK